MQPGTVSVDLDEATLSALKERLRGIKNGVGKAIAQAANETAKKVRLRIGQRIRERIPIKKSDIEPHIKIQRANPGDPSPHATVTLSKSKRIPLQYFGARQIGAIAAKRKGGSGGGVAYGIGQKFRPGAFMGPMPGAIARKLGGGVFIRVGWPTQKDKIPIRKLFGPSPWGVFVKSGAMDETLMDAKQEMDRQLLRYVNFLLLKQSGEI